MAVMSMTGASEAEAKLSPKRDGFELFGLPEISLHELSARAELLKRTDRKYLVPDRTVAEMVGFLCDIGACALTIDGLQTFSYLSDYYDTLDFALYRAAATKRRRRFKLRSRVYLDSGTHFLELKTRSGRGHNVKDRLRLEDVPVSACAAMRHGRSSVKRPDLLVRPEVREWLAERLADRGIAESRREALRVAASLIPAVRSVYTRSTLCLPGGSRLTADRGLVLCAPSGGACVEVPGVVVETKSAGRASAADRWLWSNGHRPLRISKYALGVASIHPELPSNRWNRAMKRLGDERT